MPAHVLHLRLRRRAWGLALLLAAVALTFTGRDAGAVNVAIPGGYCQLPPFLNTAVTRKPNILILQDNSGSMAYAAYRQAFEAKKPYYGYYEPDRCYEYASNLWKQSSAADASLRCANKSGNEWSGAFLNWLTMRRIDIARKVMVGGKGNPRVGAQVKLVGESNVYFGFNKFADATGYSPLTGGASYSVANNTNAFTVNLRGVLATAGAEFTCARNERDVFCWGRNAGGQLGNGTTGDETTPTTISDAYPGALTVDAGATHACAITADGSLKCWGDNTFGALGTGDTFGRTTPAALGPGPMKLPVAQVSAGRDFTCAIDAKRDLYCWGRNDAGQLGLGYASAPQVLPQKVASLAGVVDVGAGGAHACAVVEGPTAGLRSAVCWGANDQSQLGCAACGAQAASPQPVAKLTDADLRDIDAGVTHTCAVVGDAAYCWGDNASGQLGNRKAPTDNDTPQRVVTAAGGVLSDVVAV